MARAQKKAKDEQRTIVFIDESGFYLLPMAVRTYAPCGQTPILRVKLTHDHLSVIGAITPQGRLFMQMQDQAYTAEDVVRFLRLLLRKTSGLLLVIWDGSPIHRAKVIKDYLKRGAAKRLHLERLPGYAPELNPTSGRVESAQASRAQGTSAVEMSPTWPRRFDEPKNACDIGEPFCDSVSLMRAVPVSSLCSSEDLCEISLAE